MLPLASSSSAAAVLSSSARDSVPTDMVVPTREHLVSVRRLMSGDMHIGQGVPTEIVNEECISQPTQGFGVWKSICAQTV